jgi:23S rRNA-/tRNA-specific pseudouridylate synthase
LEGRLIIDVDDVGHATRNLVRPVLFHVAQTCVRRQLAVAHRLDRPTSLTRSNREQLIEMF